MYEKGIEDANYEGIKKSHKITEDMKPCLIIVLLILWAPSLFGEAGVLIPTHLDEPAPHVLSLDKMEVKIDINNQFAKVKVLQIFENHTGGTLEGEYLFSIPEAAIISDFAIWEDGVRIPGVIMEKRRARRIYERIVSVMIDPGLLEQVGQEEINVFRAKVFPIPPYGTKRLELTYTQNLRISSLRSYFNFPLSPTLYRKQKAHLFKLTLTIKTNCPIKDFFLHSRGIKLEYTKFTPYEISGRFEAHDFEFKEDFAFEYSLDIKEFFFSFLTYRKTKLHDEPIPLFTSELRREDKDGYFLASLIFNLEREGELKVKKTKPKTLFVLLDTSLSMRWEKLDRAYEAVEYFLRNLPEWDKFQLILFNDEIKVFVKNPVQAIDEWIDGALKFIQNSYLSGGTDIKGAIERALAEASKVKGRKYIILITDGHPTLNEISYKRLTKYLNSLNKRRIPFYIFGIGNDTNITFLEEMVKSNDGYFVWVNETEPLQFKLKTFLSKVGQGVIKGVSFLFNIGKEINRVYPISPLRTFNGSCIRVVGRYRKPREDVEVKIQGVYNKKKFEIKERVFLPEEDRRYPYIKRLWAKARVDFLLKLIRFKGEREEWIDEIIALSRQYKFITPYTSYLAAPRALLRPRVIKPGDPILTVKTDKSIVSVVAIFPFGLTKSLWYNPHKERWQTRFLAPKWMRDGVYHCTLILQDREGNQYEEKKSFIIDSKPPTLKVHLNKKTLHGGDELKVKVYAPRDTRAIKAKLWNLAPVDIRWNKEAKASLGTIKIPEKIPTGVYKLKIVAEDFAHNISKVEFLIEIIGS